VTPSELIRHSIAEVEEMGKGLSDFAALLRGEEEGGGR
jgi:hypothetical protein